MATYTISHPLAVEGILDTTEYLLIADATEDRFCRGSIDADPAVVDRLTRAVAEKFEQGSTVHMTADNGTDLEIPIDRASGSASGFPHNEAKPRPLPMEEINGTVVQDSFIMLVGMLEEPVEWKIEDGWIVEINGGVEAEQLKYVLDEYGNEDANAFAEFAIQTNPWARPNGNLIEHKDVGGAVHTATGTNASMGGPIEAGIHLDGVILEPTVDIDGETIVDEGAFELEY